MRSALGKSDPRGKVLRTTKSRLLARLCKSVPACFFTQSTAYRLGSIKGILCATNRRNLGRLRKNAWFFSTQRTQRTPRIAEKMLVVESLRSRHRIQCNSRNSLCAPPCPPRPLRLENQLNIWLRPKAASSRFQCNRGDFTCQRRRHGQSRRRTGTQRR